MSNAYVVAVLFSSSTGEASLSLSAIVRDDEATAVAANVAHFIREAPSFTPSLVRVVPLPSEFLEAALRETRGEDTARAAQVIQLVQPLPRPRRRHRRAPSPHGESRGNGPTLSGDITGLDLGDIEDEPA